MGRPTCPTQLSTAEQPHHTGPRPAMRPAQAAAPLAAARRLQHPAMARPRFVCRGRPAPLHRPSTVVQPQPLPLGVLQVGSPAPATPTAHRLPLHLSGRPTAALSPCSCPCPFLLSWRILGKWTWWSAAVESCGVWSSTRCTACSGLSTAYKSVRQRCPQTCGGFWPEPLR